MSPDCEIYYVFFNLISSQLKTAKILSIFFSDLPNFQLKPPLTKYFL